MTVSIQQISNTNSFAFWKDRTNELANAMSTVVVSTNSNTATGNAAISGTFTANKICIANTSTNVNITIPTTTQQSNNQYYLNANGNWSLIRSPFISGNVNITNTSSQIFDSFLLSESFGAEYLIGIKDNNGNNYHTSKFLVVHNTSVAYISEYGTISTNNSLGSFTVSTNTTHLLVNVVPTTTNAIINFIRTNV